VLLLWKETLHAFQERQPQCQMQTACLRHNERPKLSESL
jgi:hypothetical protein